MSDTGKDNAGLSSGGRRTISGMNILTKNSVVLRGRWPLMSAANGDLMDVLTFHIDEA